VFTDADKPLLRSLANVLKVSGCEVPDWIFSLDKISNKLKKRLEKFPVKRETISTDISKNRDPKFM
jgi:ATP-dependent RNA helicase DDX52/ROK1